jgi:hypothetical protein
MKRRKHTLDISYTKVKSSSDAQGLFTPGEFVSTILIERSKDLKDTLIHELCHFILYIVTGNYYQHGKKFNKLYKLIKSL